MDARSYDESQTRTTATMIERNTGSPRRIRLFKWLVLLAFGILILLTTGITVLAWYPEWSRQQDVIRLLESKNLHYETQSMVGLLKRFRCSLFDRVTSVAPKYGPQGLVSGTLTDEELLKIGELKHLRFLAIESPITDASLPVLKNLDKLETLIVCKTKLSDEGIAELRESIPNISVKRFGD